MKLLLSAALCALATAPAMDRTATATMIPVARFIVRLRSRGLLATLGDGRALASTFAKEDQQPEDDRRDRRPQNRGHPDAVADLVDGDLRVWSLGANVLAPLFTGGALEAAEDIAVAQRDAALFAFARGVLDALAEVEAALVGEARTAERLDGLAAQLASLEENEALARRRQERGSASADAWFDARSRTLGARAALVATRGQLLTQRIDLHLALGGGFDATAPTGSDAPTAPTE